MIKSLEKFEAFYYLKKNKKKICKFLGLKFFLDLVSPPPFFGSNQ